MRKLIMLALVTLPFIGFSQQQTYTVIAKIAKADTASKAHLLYYEGSKPNFFTAKLENNIFTFKGTAPGPVVAYLFLNDDGLGYRDGKLQNKLTFRLENGTIQVTATDSLRYAKVNGGAYNKDYNQYRAFTIAYENALESANSRNIQAYQAKRPKEELEVLQQELRTAGKALIARNFAYAKANPNSYASIGAIATTIGPKIDLEVYQPLYNSLSASLKASPAGKELFQKLETARSVKVGSIAPLFALADTGGRNLNLQDFRGKYLLLDFWASWCAPCRAENPNYVTNYNKYREKGLEMLGVSLDKEGEKANWINAIKTDGLTWPQVSDLKYWNGDVVKLYGVRAVPQNFLIDPEGKIVAVNLRGEDLSKKLETLFGK